MGRGRKTDKRPKPSKTKLDSQVVLALKRWEVLESLGRPAIVATAVVLCVYFGIYQPVKLSHGEQTVVRLLYGLTTSFSANVVVAWGGTIASLAFAWTVRRRWLSERKEKDERIKKLEVRLDPGRTSSGLTVSGE